MKYLILSVLIICIGELHAQSTEWHVKTVALGGSPSGNGTSELPWDLQTALNQPNTIVKPGDTVWLHGGDYKGRFTCSLIGTPSQWITVASYPGEWARIDGTPIMNGTNPLIPTCNEVVGQSEGQTTSFQNDDDDYPDDPLPNNPIIHITGGARYLILKNFEVSCLGTIHRYKDETNPNNNFVTFPGIYYSPAEVDKDISSVKLVNLVIRNIPGSAIAMWKYAADSEIYGCVMYNNGYTLKRNIDPSTIRVYGREPAIYTQNRTDLMRKIENNIFGNNFESGLFIWSANYNPQGPLPYLQNFDVGKNTFFDNGNPSRAHDGSFVYNDSKPNMVVDSNSSLNRPTNIAIHDNIMYLNQTNYISGVRVYGDNVSVNNNQFYKGNQTCAFKGGTNVSNNNNIHFGRFVTFMMTPTEYLNNGFTSYNNNYYKWTGGGMFCIPPNYQSSPIAFSSFATQYNTEYGSLGYPTTPILYRNDSMLSFGGPVTNSFQLKKTVRQNKYNPNVFYVTIFNASTGYISPPYDFVTVDFSAFGIPSGKRVKINDVHDYFNSYIPDVTNFSGSLTFNMTSNNLELPSSYYDTPCRIYRRKDFAVFRVEFLCNGMSYDSVINSVTQSIATNNVAVNNLTFSNYRASTTSGTITAKASKSILIKADSLIKSDFWGKIETTCPDIVFSGDITSTARMAENQIVETEIEKNVSFVVSPNPNSGIFKIESLNGTFLSRIVILSVDSGREVLNTTFKNIEKIFSIDISNQPNGVYILQAFDGEGTNFTQKIIKQ